MRAEQSQQSAAGTLYLVAVPIGHPDDITVRALRTLREADLIASENPEATRRLLAHHDIEAVLTSYGPFNIEEKVALLIDRLLRGAKIAFVSDCGSPLIADPGSLLVASARIHDIPVTTVPGPSALTAALAAAGISDEAVMFLGNLPESSSAIRRHLRRSLTGKVPAVAFLAIERLIPTLDLLAEVAPWLRISLACDLTKPTERIIDGPVSHARLMLQRIRPPQEVTLILRGRTRGNRGMLSRRAPPDISSPPHDESARGRRDRHALAPAPYALRSRRSAGHS